MAASGGVARGIVGDELVGRDDDAGVLGVIVRGIAGDELAERGGAASPADGLDTGGGVLGVFGRASPLPVARASATTGTEPVLDFGGGGGPPVGVFGRASVMAGIEPVLDLGGGGGPPVGVFGRASPSAGIEPVVDLGGGGGPPVGDFARGSPGGGVPIGGFALASTTGA